MWPDRVSNLGPLALESDTLSTALRGQAVCVCVCVCVCMCVCVCTYTVMSPVVVALLFYVHGKHLRSCRDGQLT